MIEDEQETPSDSDPAGPVEPPGTGPSAAVHPIDVENPPRYYFLTNRMNLNGILSSRLIAPRDSFYKYYADLLDSCPGWVPVLTGPPSPSLIESAAAERGSGGPVLLELAGDVVDTAKVDGPVVYVHAVPFSKVSAIHFPDEKSLREHRARGYKNVQPHEDLVRVTPELFTSDSPDNVLIERPGEAPTIDWTRIDRIRGAINGLLAASDSGEALALAAKAIGAGGMSGDIVVPPWLNWDQICGHSMTAESEDASMEADRLIFESAYRVLGGHDKAESWSPGDILRQVADQIAAAKPSEEAQKIVGRGLQRVEELLNIEQEFEPFRNPDSPFVAAKAFLMVLLRPDLDQLLAWPAAETGADETTRSVAALLAGRLRGLSREGVKLRNAQMDDLTADWAVRSVDGSAGLIGSVSFVASASETRVLVDASTVMESTPLLPDPVLLYEAMSAKSRPAARVAVSRGLGWPVVVRVSVPAGSEVLNDGPLITITSVGSVKVETSVEESQFLENLRAVRGEARRKVDALLSKTK